MTTPNFELPEWEQAQSQPHVTVDTALRILECLSMLIIQDRDLDEPPAGSSTPLDGECFIVNGTSSSGTGVGEWADANDGDVAMMIGTGWVFRTPQVGWRAYILDEDVDVRFGSTSGWGVI